jgi:hypothetical protein
LRKIILALWSVLILNEAHGTAAAPDGVASGLYERSIRLTRISSEEFIAELAMGFYEAINGTFGRMEAGEAPIVNSEYWELIEGFETRGGRTTAMCSLDYKQVMGSPSDALSDLLNKGGAIDGPIAMTLVQALITRELMGKERFNEFFREGLGLPSTLRTLRETGIGIPQNPGESGYICNVDEYSMLQPEGSAHGHNVFCVGITDGSPVYSGFGLFFARSRPRTAAEILDNLYQATILPNEPTKNGDLRLELLMEEFRTGHVLWDEMQETAQTGIPRHLIMIMPQLKIPAEAH